MQLEAKNQNMRDILKSPVKCLKNKVKKRDQGIKPKFKNQEVQKEPLETYILLIRHPLSLHHPDKSEETLLRFSQKKNQMNLLTTITTISRRTFKRTSQMVMTTLIIFYLVLETTMDKT